MQTRFMVVLRGIDKNRECVGGMKFYMHSKDRMALVVSLAAIWLFTFWMSGFKLNEVNMIVLLIEAVYLAFKQKDNATYEIVGQSIEFEFRGKTQVYDINQIKHIEVYLTKYGAVGAASKETCFMNHAGSLVKINLNLKSDDGENLAEVLESQYKIKRIKK